MVTMCTHILDDDQFRKCRAFEEAFYEKNRSTDACKQQKILGATVADEIDPGTGQKAAGKSKRWHCFN